MGVVPHGTGDDDLDLLTTGQRADLVVVGDFGIETKILKVLADDGRLELTVSETLARSLMVVELLDELGIAKLEEGLARDVRVVLGEEALPFSGDEVSNCPRIKQAEWEKTYTSYWNVFLYF